MFCKKCGKELKEGAKFCPKCGMAVPMAKLLEHSNRKKRKLHRRVAAVVTSAVLVLGTCSGVFVFREEILGLFRNEEDVYTTVNNALNENIVCDTFKNADFNERKKIAEETLQNLEEGKEIKENSVQYSEDGYYYFNFTNGAEGFVSLLDQDENTDGESILYDENNQQDSIIRIPDFQTENLNTLYQEGEKKAIIIDQLGRDYQSKNFDLDASEWSKCSLKTTVKHTITADEMKTALKGYDYIYIRCHGYFDSIQQKSMVCLEEKMSSKNSLDKGYAGDLSSGRIAAFYSSSFGSYALNPSFFSYYYKDNQLQDSIVWIGCCQGYKSDKLVKAFSKVGSKTVIGATETVNTMYGTKMADEFTYQLLNGKDTAYALASAKEKYGQNDGSTPPAEFKIYDDGTAEIVRLFTLTDEAKAALEAEKSTADVTAYSTVLSQFISTYGMPGTSVDEFGNNSGTFCRLLDFNQDGIEELYLGGYKPDEAHVEIYTLKNNAPDAVYTKDFVSASIDDFHGIIHDTSNEEYYVYDYIYTVKGDLIYQYQFDGSDFNAKNQFVFANESPVDGYIQVESWNDAVMLENIEKDADGNVKNYGYGSGWFTANDAVSVSSKTYKRIMGAEPEVTQTNALVQAVLDNESTWKADIEAIDDKLNDSWSSAEGEDMFYFQDLDMDGELEFIVRSKAKPGDICAYSQELNIYYWNESNQKLSKYNEEEPDYCNATTSILLNELGETNKDMYQLYKDSTTGAFQYLRTGGGIDLISGSLNLLHIDGNNMWDQQLLAVYGDYDLTAYTDNEGNVSYEGGCEKNINATSYNDRGDTDRISYAEAVEWYNNYKSNLTAYSYTTKKINLSDWDSMSSEEKQQALEDSYNAWSYSEGSTEDFPLSAVMKQVESQASAAEQTQSQSAYKDAYRQKIQELSANTASLNTIDYCLCDMNADGIPELIVKTGTGEANYVITFYTYKNDAITVIGDGFSGWHSGFYYDSDTKQFCTQWGQMGVGGIRWYAFDGNTVTETNYIDGIEYTDTENFEATMAPYGTFSDVETAYCSYWDDDGWVTYYYTPTADDPYASTKYSGIDYSIIDNY